MKKLAYHSTLIQAFDPARFRSDRASEAARATEARTEVLLNLLFGREVVLPAGHIADSPAVAIVYREVLSAFEALPLARRNAVRLKAFRVALEPGYADYSDYVRKYVDVGAPTVSLPIDQQRAQVERAKALAYVKGLYLAGDYAQLERVTGQDGFAEYARLVTCHLGHDAVQRPVMQASPPDLVNIVRRHLEMVPADRREIYHAEIAGALPFFSQTEGCRAYRGLWYAHATRFGTHWDLVRAWLDQALYFNLTHSYGVRHPVLMSQELASGRYHHDDIVISELQNGPINIKAVDYAAIDWATIWRMVSEPDFQQSLSKLTVDLETAQFDHQPIDSLHRHAELINDRLTALSLNLRQGRLELDRKGPSVAPSLAMLAGGATMVVLGSFIPLPASTGLDLIKFLGEAGLGGGLGAIVARESAYFTQRRQQALQDSNSNAVRDALNHVVAVTKISTM